MAILVVLGLMVSRPRLVLMVLQAEEHLGLVVVEEQGDLFGLMRQVLLQEP